MSVGCGQIQARQRLHTDPEARKMRFADGSYGPGYNVQIATTADTGFILSAIVTDWRDDSGAAPHLINDIKRRFARTPEHLVCDTTYATVADIAALGERVKIWAPLPMSRRSLKSASLKARAARSRKEPPPVRDWRTRMQGSLAEIFMKKRKRIELTNAHLKNRGMPKLRGADKITAADPNIGPQPHGKPPSATTTRRLLTRKTPDTTL